MNWGQTRGLGPVTFDHCSVSRAAVAKTWPRTIVDEPNKKDTAEHVALRFATMHRAKGLEFGPRDEVANKQLIMNSIDQIVDEYKRSIDRTLLRENLQRTPDERLLNLMELQRLAEELKRAGEQHRAQR